MHPVYLSMSHLVIFPKQSDTSPIFKSNYKDRHSDLYITR